MLRHIPPRQLIMISPCCTTHPIYVTQDKQLVLQRIFPFEWRLQFISIMISIMSESENLQKLNFVYDISAPSRSYTESEIPSHVCSRSGVSLWMPSGCRVEILMGFSTAQLLIVPNIDTDTETRQQYQWINNLCTQDVEHHFISIQHSDGVRRCIAPLPSSGAGGEGL